MELRQRGWSLNIILSVPAREAKGAAPLGPILGQYQINIVKFCKEFNEQSRTFVAGVPVRCLIQKKGMEYRFVIFKPSLTFFFKHLLYREVKDNRERLLLGAMTEPAQRSHLVVTLVELYDVVVLLNFFEKKGTEQVAQLVFGSLGSFFSKVRILGI